MFCALIVKLLIFMSCFYTLILICLSLFFLVRQQMENYIMYNELGAGSNCAVYKGRKKGTLSFVALISTDKAMKPFIANHVGCCFLTCRKLLHLNFFYKPIITMLTVVSLTGVYMQATAPP